MRKHKKATRKEKRRALLKGISDIQKSGIENSEKKKIVLPISPISLFETARLLKMKARQIKPLIESLIEVPCNNETLVDVRIEVQKLARKMMICRSTPLS